MKELPKSHIAILARVDFIFNHEALFPVRSGKKNLAFSEKTIHKMVEEESKRDTSVIIEREGQSLRSMSSGERKVAVLTYLISLKPDFLWIENFYDNLDVQNKVRLEKLILAFSNKGIVIQVVRKEKDLLSFIESSYCFDENSGLIPYHKDISTFFDSLEPAFSKYSIPKTTTKYKYDFQEFVKLTDVCVNYFGKPILKNISWEIKLGEFWQLIGENGSGKSTLLSLITGDNHKAYGQNIILFDKLKGTEENVWEIKQKIGYFTPTITELFNRRHSVLHMVLSGFYDSIGLYVKPMDIHVKLAHQWIELIGMTKLSNATFSTLSLSQQRIILITRAMVKQPPLLILDEPTSGLDKKNTSLVVSLINKMAKETMTAIIYVSHSVEKGLSPNRIYKLESSESGSIGKIL